MQVAAFEYRRPPALTENVVRKVVSEFYAHVREDEVLGPVFEGAIGPHWDEHIERINRFWLTATRLGSGYKGNEFMPAHLRHASIRADLIPRWLKLFQEIVDKLCPPE